LYKLGIGTLDYLNCGEWEQLLNVIWRHKSSVAILPIEYIVIEINTERYGRCNEF